MTDGPVGVDRVPLVGLSSVTDIIDEARHGRMFILVDDENRENEGDLVIPAQMTTPSTINFMARHGRGLVCLALTAQRASELELTPMVRENKTRHGTAFTASIEAREGITTGISAADRARTVSVAVNAAHGADQLVSPGHVFPLVARDGGVLVRAGHTEAAVDIARLAGLNPSGVICEIMNEDGTMARMPDLATFALEHDLKIGTIRDLIAYRLRHDHLLKKRAEIEFESRWGGQWRMMTFVYEADGAEQIALVKGEVDPAKPTLVRMHAFSPLEDTFGERSDRGGLLERSMDIIGTEGAGIVVIITPPVEAWMTTVIGLRIDQAEDPRNAGLEVLRDYGIGAQILTALGVEDMVLLTNSHHTLVALEGYGLSIVGERPIPPG